MKYFLPLLLIISYVGHSQQYSFEAKVVDDHPKIMERFISSFNEVSLDSVNVLQKIKSIRSLLYQKGYMRSSAELVWSDTTANLSITIGKTYIWANPRIVTDDDFPLTLESSEQIKGNALSESSLKFLSDQYLVKLENNGYPFAQIQFTEYSINNDTIKGKLKIESGPFVTLDSIVVKGYDHFSKNVLRYNFLFKKGMPYSEVYLKKIKEYISQIEYLEFERPPAVAFSRDKTILYLYIKEIKSSQVDGVVGLNTDADGKATLTGDFQLKLLHILKSGEQIDLKWQRPNESISNLNLALNLPFIFKSPFGIQGGLSIFRQDTSFVNTDSKGFLNYNVQGGSSINFGIGFQSSNILLTSPGASFSSYQTVSYNFGFNYNATDQLINPSKGNQITLNLFTAQRSTEDETLNQYGWAIEDSYYLSLFRNHLLKLKILSESNFGGALFENELYRIGGFKTLRGFNEQSIYASSYGVGTFEYRYRISEQNFLAAFTDIAYIENSRSKATTRLYGFGAGISFKTVGGIFSLFYALGKDSNNPVDFQNSKLHFGYINRF